MFFCLECVCIFFFGCNCHHLDFFNVKSLITNTLRNHSFTFLTKTVIISSQTVIICHHFAAQTSGKRSFVLCSGMC